jgi:hypothetical protein
VIPVGIYPKERKTEYSSDTCTPMFIAAPFTIDKLWKQLRCPTTDEWIIKLWHIYSMEYYSATGIMTWNLKVMNAIGGYHVK